MLYLWHLKVQRWFYRESHKFSTCTVGRLGCCCHHMATGY